MLYFRQILIMAVSLYTVRVVLNVLGAEDYGIYNVVAGVVTMFGFLSGAMATASQRYFSFDLGQDNTEHLKTTFSVTFQIYLLLALVIVLLAETAGLWFMNTKLVIPAERMSAANCIYQAAIVSFLLTLITTPYMASIIAHENMNVYAYVSIVEVALKLGIVFLLKVLAFDKLIVYGVLLAAVALINTSVYRLYCRRHYEECKIKLIWDWTLFKELFFYGGWNLIGSFASVLRGQGISIILNLFFGSVVNAARGISLQVSNALMTFSSNFSVAIRPQIIKSYAQNDKNESYSLVFRGSRFCFFLFLLPSIPVLLNTDYLLSLWLKKIPEQTVLFTRLVLLDCLVDSMRFPLLALMHAHGNMKLYQISVSGFLLLNLPLSYVLLKFGMNAASVMILSIFLSFLSLCVRLIVLKKMAGLPVRKYITNVFLRTFLVSIFSAIAPSFLLCFFLCNSLAVFLAQSFLCVLWTVMCIWVFGVNGAERRAIATATLSKIRRRKI